MFNCGRKLLVCVEVCFQYRLRYLRFMHELSKFQIFLCLLELEILSNLRLCLLTYDIKHLWFDMRFYPATPGHDGLDYAWVREYCFIFDDCIAVWQIYLKEFGVVLHWVVSHWLNLRRFICSCFVHPLVLTDDVTLEESEINAPFMEWVLVGSDNWVIGRTMSNSHLVLIAQMVVYSDVLIGIIESPFSRFELFVFQRWMPWTVFVRRCLSEARICALRPLHLVEYSGLCV